jgi:hypothetical protein
MKAHHGADDALTGAVEAHPGAMEVQGVIGNKCAGQHNLKTVYFKGTTVSGYFLAWSSSICVFFCSTLSNTGRRRRTHF